MRKQQTSSRTGSWDHVANWYDSLVGSKGQYFHQHVIFPKLVPLLELSSEHQVLDLACGQGAFGREIATSVAHVVGVDASASLIEKARKYGTGQSPIEYIVDDARTLTKLEGKTFDRIVSILAIQNFDPLDGMFARIASLLVPDGTFTAVILHPAFRSPRITGWGEDEKRHLQYRRIDRYLQPMKIPIDMHPGKRDKHLTWTYHRPLSQYVDYGARVGLAVDHVGEWTSDKESVGKHAKKENLAREEIPLFAAIRYRNIK